MSAEELTEQLLDVYETLDALRSASVEHKGDIQSVQEKLEHVIYSAQEGMLND